MVPVRIRFPLRERLGKECSGVHLFICSRAVRWKVSARCAVRLLAGWSSRAVVRLHGFPLSFPRDQRAREKGNRQYVGTRPMRLGDRKCCRTWKVCTNGRAPGLENRDVGVNASAGVRILYFPRNGVSRRCGNRPVKPVPSGKVGSIPTASTKRLRFHTSNGALVSTRSREPA